MRLTLTCAQHVYAHTVVRLLHGQEGAAGGVGLGGVSTLPREPPAEEVRKAAAWYKATHELVVCRWRALLLVS